MSVNSISDAGGLASSYLAMEGPEALDVARTLFGLSGRATRFATEKDDTFRLDATDGTSYVLKIANPSEDESEIDFQVQLMAQVGRRDPGLPVPRVVPTLEGDLHVEIEDRARQRRRVRLMSFLAGTPLDVVESTAPQRERVGETLAHLRHATAGFAHRGDSRVLAWDVQHLMRLEPLLDAVEDRRQKCLLAAGMERFATIEPAVAGLRRQVLHNDFSKSNIVVDPGDPAFVTGIIDFGDSVRTAIAVDVSTALLNQLPRHANDGGTDDLFSDGRDVLRGYLRHADLTDEELALIPHLTMARVVARALITLWRVKKFPGNAAYIMRNTEQGWAQLDWFMSRSVEQISATLLPAPGAASRCPTVSRIEA